MNRQWCHKRTLWGSGDTVTFPTLKNWPLFGQKFWTFGQSIQLHSHVNELVYFPNKGKIMAKSTAKYWPKRKNNLRLFCNSFWPWWQNRHCRWVNWNHVVIPTAFIKFEPTKNFIQVLGKIIDIWVNYEYLGMIPQFQLNLGK